MLVHVVLFRLRPNLFDGERETLLRLFERAVREIPSVVRAMIGPRVTHGAGYEQANRDAFPYAATIEFRDLAGLQAYLQHSAHAEPAQRFFAAIEGSLIADYSLETLA